MKKYLLIIGLLIVSFSLQAQTTVYNGTRIFTGIFRIAAGAQFDFKGNYIVDSQSGDTLATVEGMRTIIQQYIGSYQETDPIYSNDSSKLVMWSDTLNKIVTVKRLIDSLENVYDQIALKLNASDTARYISKSQARKDIHDSIVPLRADVEYLKQLTDTTSELVARTIYISMPTDPQTPGSDVIGDGSINKPYATINRALRSIKPSIYAIITLQLDSGAFDFKIKDRDLINKLLTTTSSAIQYPYLIIKGTIYKEPINFSYTITSLGDIKKVVGYTFTPNYLRGKFLGISSNPTTLYPLEGNWNDTILGVPNKLLTINNVYTNLTTINIESNRYTTYFNSYIGIYNLIMNYAAIGVDIGKVYGRFNNILINSTSGFGVIIRNSFISQNYISTKYLSTTVSAVEILDNSYFNSNIVCNNGTTRKTSGTGVSISNSFLGGIVISGYLTGINIKSDPLKSLASPFSIYFRDCTSIFGNPSTDNANYQIGLEQLGSYYCTNMLRAYGSSISGTVNIKEIKGTSLNIFNPLSTVKYFNNISSGWFLNVSSTYPEYQSGQLYTLANNSTDSISIADLSYNRSINIDYTITRNGQYRTGSMKVLNTGTTYLFDPGDYIESADVGVTFQGVFKSGNSNTLKLKWTTTNTGQNASIQIDYRRQNF